MTNDALNGKLLGLVRRERALTQEILVLVNLVEARGLHLEMGYSSLFHYLTKYLGYCESSAYRRMQAARLLKVVPDAREKLVEGKLQLTQMARVQSAGKSVATKRQMLKAVEGKNLEETKKVLAQEFGAVERPRKQVTYTRDHHVNLTLRLSSAQFAKYQKVKALLSHAVPEGSPEAIFEKLLDQVIAQKTEIRNPPKTTEAKGRTPLNTTLRKAIFAKYNYECQYKNCRSNHFLEIEHIQPLAHGGTNTPENLTVLCRAHNQLKARQAGFF